MRSNFLAIIAALLPLCLQPTVLAAPVPNTRRCMTEEQIEAIRNHWPKFAGHGPVIHPCKKTDGDEAANDDATATEAGFERR